MPFNSVNNLYSTPFMRFTILLFLFTDKATFYVLPLSCTLRMNIFSLLSALLAVAISVLAAPAPAASVNEDPWEQCEARLNGQLPYYVPPTFHFSGNVRRYYVAAEVEEWDYAPTGKAPPEDYSALFSLTYSLSRLGQLAWCSDGRVLPSPDMGIHSIQHKHRHQVRQGALQGIHRCYLRGEIRATTLGRVPRPNHPC